jgi:hypothetical protein
MSDWVDGSSRMKWLAGVSMATWLAGVILALLAAEGRDPLSSSAAILIICAFSISGPVVVFSAWRLPAGGWLRTVWSLIALGLTIKITLLVTSMLRNMFDPLSTGPFQGGMDATVWGYVPIVAAVMIAVWRLHDIPEQRIAVVRAISMPVILYLAFLAALVAPGPAMPFEIGPRDVTGIVRLTVDMLLVFMPAVYCVAATIQSDEGHRARSWMWLAIGALMWAMADVVYPLVDLSYGQVYPILLWALGVHLIAMGASLTLDFEQAALAEQDA